MILTDRSECENGKLRVSVERWRIDGTESPSLVDTRALNVSCADVQWSLYNTPCSRKLAFIPQSTSVINPGTVALLDSGSVLRIGSRILFRKDDPQGLQYMLAGSKTPWTTASGDGTEVSANKRISKLKILETPGAEIVEDAALLKEYCEEIAHQDNLLVICRRRIPKLESSKREPQENRRKRRTTRTRRRYSDLSGDDFSDPDDIIDGEGPALSDISSLESTASSDSLRSASNDSESSDADENSDLESISGGPETDGFDMDPNSAESSVGSGSISSLEEAEEDDTEETDSSSLLAVPSSESSDDEIYNRQINGDDDLDFPNDYEYPVEIAGQPLDKTEICNKCGEVQLQTWYHCAVCFYGNYNLCHQCVKDGNWCLDQKHQLHEEVNGVGVVSVISWSDFVLGQKLLVFDTTSTMENPIFTYSMVESASLHRSAPAVHPQLPIVVWPICAEKLLFADISKTKTSKKRCFSVQSFKATSSKGKSSL